jgi:hypothetical protein
MSYSATMGALQPILNVTVSLPAISYDATTIDRADRTFRCSLFHLKLLLDMRYSGVSITKISGSSGVELGYTKRKMPELIAESDMVWLIQVGMLRREVDGQGLTDSFRLTPLGWQIANKWDGKEVPQPRKRDRLQNFISRWLRSVL